MAFIEVTMQNEEKTKVLVNVDAITHLEAAEAELLGCDVYLLDSNVLSAAETYQEVVAMIKTQMLLRTAGNQ